MKRDYEFEGQQEEHIGGFGNGEREEQNVAIML